MNQPCDEFKKKVDKRVLAIIVIYNGARFLDECICSLIHQSQKTDILIVDNASDDYSDRIIQKYIDNESQSRVIYNRLENNIGFTGGNNLGIKYALEEDYDYTLLINEDTVAADNLVEELLRFSDDETVTAPIMYMDKGLSRIWYCGGDFIDNCSVLNMFDAPSSETCRKVGFVTGCCMMVNSSIWRKVGLFSDRYYMYYEDVDFSMRLQLAGVTAYCISSTYLWHRVLHREDSSYKAYYMVRNKLLFIAKFRSHFSKPMISYLQWEWHEAFNADLIAYRDVRIQGIIDFLLKRTGKKEFKTKSLSKKNQSILLNQREKNKYRSMYSITTRILEKKAAGFVLSDWLMRYGYKTAAIYGMHSLGRFLVHELKSSGIDVLYGIDQKLQGNFEGIPIYNMNGELPAVDIIIVTPIMEFDNIHRALWQKGDFCVISIADCF